MNVQEQPPPPSQNNNPAATVSMAQQQQQTQQQQPQQATSNLIPPQMQKQQSTHERVLMWQQQQGPYNPGYTTGPMDHPTGSSMGHSPAPNLVCNFGGGQPGNGVWANDHQQQQPAQSLHLDINLGINLNDPMTTLNTMNPYGQTHTTSHDHQHHSNQVAQQGYFSDTVHIDPMHHNVIMTAPSSHQATRIDNSIYGATNDIGLAQATMDYPSHPGAYTYATTHLVSTVPPVQDNNHQLLPSGAVILQTNKEPIPSEISNILNDNQVVGRCHDQEHQNQPSIDDALDVIRNHAEGSIYNRSDDVYEQSSVTQHPNNDFGPMPTIAGTSNNMHIHTESTLRPVSAAPESLEAPSTPSGLSGTKGKRSR